MASESPRLVHSAGAVIKALTPRQRHLLLFLAGGLLGDLCTIVAVEEDVWRGGLARWTDAEGTVWTRRRPRLLRERDARRFVLRASTLVALEQKAVESEGFDLKWLEPATHGGYWQDHIAGHVDDGTGQHVPANNDGWTFRVSTWTNDAGQRLILLSEMC
jgi:hypothetical protein